MQSKTGSDYCHLHFPIIIILFLMLVEPPPILLCFSGYSFYISLDHFISIDLLQILSIRFNFYFPTWQHEHQRSIYEIIIWPFTLSSLVWLIFSTIACYLSRLT